MRTHFRIQGANDPDRAGLQDLFDRQAARIERRLKHFASDMVHLDGRAEVRQPPKPIRVSLRLHLPRTVLATHEEATDPAVALRASFDELERKLDRHLAYLRHEHARSRRRPRPARALEEQAPRIASREALVALGELTGPHLDALYDFLHHELTYLECSGTVPEGALTVTDLLDAVMLRALDQLEGRPEDLTPYEWLLQVALEVLQEQVRAFEGLPESLATEAPPPEPAEEPTRQDHEFWQFYQPDESLHLEDLIPDATVPDPEEQAASDEWSAAMEVHRGLAALPARWRQATSLHLLDDMPVERVASVLHATRAEVEREVGAALDFLAARAGTSEPREATVARIRHARRRVVVPTAYREQLARVFRSDDAAG